MPSHEERAWSVINELRDGWCYAPCAVQAGCGCSEAIAKALAGVEREALRKAENIIIEAALDDAMRRHLRQSIRSLIGGEKT